MNIHFGIVDVLTIKECIQVVIVNFAKFEKVFACLGTRFDFKVDDEIAEGRLEQDGHDTA